MKLALIQSELKKYKSYLSEHLDNDQNFKWEVLQNFETHWNVEDQDLLGMYTRSLHSEVTGYLWNGEKNSPKELMKQMITVNPEFSRSIFRDLFNEERELLLRLDRVGYHCDQLMGDIEKKYGKTISHYHHDLKILSIYLAFAKPKVYCIFDYPAFKVFAEKIGVIDIPADYAILRFFKIMRAIYNIISKDQELQELQAKRLEPQEFSSSTSLLLCHDFYHHVGNNIC